MTDQLDRASHIMKAGAKKIVLREVRAYRLRRVQEQLRKHNCPTIFLYDPVNIRYATDTSNMLQVWSGRNPARYIMVFADGRIVAWEFHSSEHVWHGLDLNVELRGIMNWTFFNAGHEAERRAQAWGAVFRRKQAPGDTLLAVDRLDPFGSAYLEKQGLTLLDGQALMETAWLIKSTGALVLMGESLRTAEMGIDRMRRELRPGITENDLWANLPTRISEMAASESKRGCSHPATAPIRGCTSARRACCNQATCFAFDTDMVGPNGSCSDISRTWLVGNGRPSDEQRKLYKLAYAQVHFNMEVLRPGMTFKEFSDKAWRIPNHQYVKNRYCCLAHGIGMVDEFLSIAHQVDWDAVGYDGRFETGMTVYVESYIGADGGIQGVKLEQQVVVTEHGCVPLTNCSFEDDWL